ncbi:universal stress protein [Aeromicrobium sp.]|jgi:nucleotide-binding universal stress UspA family protein|uniref:universal stress protein n=1 Tax=Aeromicrobium sp. TaxID=1871063 RepID=UPI002620FA39|nr:universal stress protein [Aeromicrobium sp.]
MTIRREITAHGGMLVGHDGSEVADRALRTAVRSAAALHSRVTVVRAWDVFSAPRPDTWRAGFVPPMEDFEASALRALDEDVEPVRASHPDVEIETQVVHGYAAENLIAASEHVDLVVVGSRGHGGFAGLLLGSVSEQVVRHAGCPVLVDRGRGDIVTTPDEHRAMELALLSELGLGDPNPAPQDDGPASGGAGPYLHDGPPGER